MSMQRQVNAERALFWRDEIPEAMFWLEGEGLGDRVEARLLERFLPIGAKVDFRYLEALVEEGLLRRTAAGLYELTDEGRTHGERVFADDFDVWSRSGDNDCGGANCVCWATPEQCPAGQLPPL